jgi:AraC-like DNA-binding protein
LILQEQQIETADARFTAVTYDAAYLNGSSSTNGRAEPGEIWKARNFIRDRLAERLSLAEVAQAAHMSPNYLSEKFKKVTGENFVAYINARRVGKARDSLCNPALRITEIAFASGFQSISQFNRVFRKLTGQSPTQFRQDAWKQSAPRA